PPEGILLGTVRCGVSHPAPSQTSPARGPLQHGDLAKARFSPCGSLRALRPHVALQWLQAGEVIRASSQFFRMTLHDLRCRRRRWLVKDSFRMYLFACE